MKRFGHLLVNVGLALLLIVLIIGAIVLVIGFVVPDSVTSLRFGADLFQAQVTEQTSALVKAVHLNPIVDVLLVVGAYLVVSLINWTQDSVAGWWTNRKHFE